MPRLLARRRTARRGARATPSIGWSSSRSVRPALYPVSPPEASHPATCSRLSIMPRERVCRDPHASGQGSIGSNSPMIERRATVSTCRFVRFSGRGVRLSGAAANRQGCSRVPGKRVRPPRRHSRTAFRTRAIGLSGSATSGLATGAKCPGKVRLPNARPSVLPNGGQPTSPYARTSCSASLPPNCHRSCPISSSRHHGGRANAHQRLEWLAKSFRGAVSRVEVTQDDRVSCLRVLHTRFALPRQSRRRQEQ